MWYDANMSPSPNIPPRYTRPWQVLAAYRRLFGGLDHMLATYGSYGSQEKALDVANELVKTLQAVYDQIEVRHRETQEVVFSWRAD